MDINSPVIVFNRLRGTIVGSCILYGKQYYMVELEERLTVDQVNIPCIPVHEKYLKLNDIPALVEHLIECI